MPLNILENGNGDTMPKVIVDNDMNTDPSEVTDEYLITKQFKSFDFSQHIEKEAGELSQVILIPLLHSVKRIIWK